MKSRGVLSEIQDLLMKEYDVINMSLTVEYNHEGIAEIEMLQSGLIKLMNDLSILKASKDSVSDGIPERPPREAIKCTFDEVMRFEDIHSEGEDGT